MRLFYRRHMPLSSKHHIAAQHCTARIAPMYILMVRPALRVEELEQRQLTGRSRHPECLYIELPRAFVQPDTLRRSIEAPCQQLCIGALAAHPLAEAAVIKRAGVTLPQAP